MRIFLILLGAFVAFLPTLFFFLLKGLLNPTGFWEKAFTYGFGLYLLGGLQILFWILLVGWIISVLDNFD